MTATHRPHYEALYDPDNFWWAVSEGNGCYANALTENEARDLASALNRTLNAYAEPADLSTIAAVLHPREDQP